MKSRGDFARQVSEVVSGVQGLNVRATGWKLELCGGGTRLRCRTQVVCKLPELIEQAEAGARVTITKRGIAVVEIVRKGDAPRKRVFGVLGDKKVINDPNWARAQNDVEAWLAGDV